MQKASLCHRPSRGGNRYLTKTWMIMQWTGIFLLACGLSVSARTISQTVTYSGTNVPLKQVLQSVEQQTGTVFFYDADVIARAQPITVNAREQELKAFLETILKNQPLQFSIEANAVVISAKKTSTSSSTHSTNLATPPIAGIVRGPDGQPLANVNVQVKGTNRGTTTDINGRFSIDADYGSTLVISSVGYATKEIKASEQQTIIDLAINNNPLDEVQIMAYSNTSRRYQIGNVSTVKASEIEKNPVSNPLLALQGRVPGITVDQVSGLPGSSINIKIQGVISLGSGSEPLYVIDGVPYTSNLLPSTNPVLGGTLGGAGSPLSFIIPSDIESIDVLKDADATSIYGSRAAAGAILITTRKGKAGKTTVAFNLQSGAGEVTRKMKLMKTAEYLTMRKEAYRNDGVPIPDASITPSPDNYDLTFWNQNRYTDWQKELIGNTAQFTNITGSVSGGNANTQFLFNSTYNKQGTVFPGNFNDQKASGHLNVANTSTNKKFRFLVDLKYVLDNNKLPPADLTSAAIFLPPNAPALYTSDGNLNWESLSNGVSSWRNPLANMMLTSEVNTKNLIANSMLAYKLAPDLELSSSFDYTDLRTHEYMLAPSTTQVPENRASYQGSSVYNDGTINSWQVQPQLKYNFAKRWGSLNAIAGLTFYNIEKYGQEVMGYGYTNDQQLGSLTAAPFWFVQSKEASQYRYNAIFSRLNYNYKDRYILAANIRRDGSSRFGVENRFHTFWSLAGGWIFTSEKLFGQHFKLLSFGKLKASFGTSGNDQIGDYKYLSLYEPISYSLPYQGSTGNTPNALPNPYLQWEETKKLNVGVELGFINNRILASANYYQNRSSNQLIGYNLPAITGFQNIVQNFPALIQNSGWEVVLSADPIQTRNIKWSVGINVTLPENKLLSFPDLEKSASYAQKLIVGKPFLNMVRGIHFAGVDTQSGKYLFIKPDGTTTTSPTSADRDYIFRSINTYLYGGIQNTFTYKSVELSFLLQFTKQTGERIDRFNPLPGRFYSDGGGTFGNQPMTALNRWQKPGDIALVPRYSQDGSVNTSSYARTPGAYDDASYLRLKNMALSVHMPSAIVRAIHAEKVSLFIQAQNVITITNYKGFDPETLRSFVLPPLKIYTVGINATF